MTNSVGKTSIYRPKGWGARLAADEAEPRPKTGHCKDESVSLLSGFLRKSRVKQPVSPRKRGLTKDGIPAAKASGMDNNINKATVPFLSLALVIIAAIGAKIRATIDAQAPEGYEDESGFHFGSPNLKH